MAASGGIWSKGAFYSPGVQQHLTPSQLARLQKRELGLGGKTVDRLRKKAGHSGGSDSARVRRAVRDIEASKSGWGGLRRDELVAMRARINATLGDEQPDPPPTKKARGRVGSIVQARGADPTKAYDVRYELRELDEVVTSNTDSGAVNPAYPAELQPRDRSRAASRDQINRIAATLEPDALVGEYGSLDRGAPILGPDNAVESGNGRMMSLRKAQQDHPERYAAYRQRLEEIAAERGIDPDEVRKMNNPVLVRVRQTDVDRVAFAEEANTSAALGMSDTERAKGDARRISPAELGRFTSSGNIDDDIRRTSNREFVRAFVGELPPNERAQALDRNGELTQTGAKRLKAAMFTRVYDDTRLADRIFESQDNELKNITNGMMASLGPLAQAEEQVRRGERDATLSISGDVAVAVNKLATLKDQNMPPEIYLRQQPMFGREMTPDQERIMMALHERRRSGKAVGELLSGWATIVERQPHPEQAGMFGGASASREELIDRWLSAPAQEDRQSGMF